MLDLKENASGKDEEGPNCSRLLSITRHRHDPDFMISRWSIEIHTFIAMWGEFEPTLVLAQVLYGTYSYVLITTNALD